MRRVFIASTLASLLALSLAAAPMSAEAQTRPTGGQQSRDRDQPEGGPDGERARAPRIAPLRRRAAAGPCPYVKILYDAARYVELTGDRITSQNVGFTGEIEGLVSDCAYQSDQPIEIETRVLFNLGRGPQAQGDQRTYRYWIAVTERNKAILAKEYFDLPVNFDGQQTALVTQDQTVIIPRMDATVSGDNFEILIGFDVTPAMAEFNATGSRFRVNAGAAAAAPAATPAQPPAQ